VGYDQGGLMTEAINKTPHCVLLLDEIEKAHTDVFNLLLQVMDHGTLTDNNGRKADFRNVILIMTTNEGAADTTRASIGFTEQDHTTDAMESIKRRFTPEFRNRLDAIVQFDHLSQDVMLGVVDKFIQEVQIMLDEKKVILEFTEEAKNWLAEKGYDQLYGARPMSRLVQDTLKKPLAERILFGDLSDKGGDVLVVLNDKGDGLEFELKEEANSDEPVT
jgi:ATP-dependent Clp protease ATP-binding subunit ClpA